MGYFDNLIAQGKAMLKNYGGDKTFLAGIAAASANVINADGKVDESEIDAGLSGMKANKLVGDSYSNAEIESALMAAIERSKTRLGKMENTRAIQALAKYPAEDKQNVLLVAADIADDNGIAAEEYAVLAAIAKELSLDLKQLGIEAPAPAA